jgi:uncharacterized protein YndB with AHSA1/START domain
VVILKCVILVMLVIVGLMVYAATRPSTFTIQRSIAIAAPMEKIYPFISDLHNWPLWAPQDNEDPSMQRTFSGASAGQGASSHWTGKGSGGSGEMTITSSEPKAISIQVDWTRPFRLHNVNDFTLQPDGNDTTVTWTMRGANNYMLKLMSVFVSPDRMMGKHFEDGLKNLKAVAER